MVDFAYRLAVTFLVLGLVSAHTVHSREIVQGEEDGRRCADSNNGNITELLNENDNFTGYIDINLKDNAQEIFQQCDMKFNQLAGVMTNEMKTINTKLDDMRTEILQTLYQQNIISTRTNTEGCPYKEIPGSQRCFKLFTDMDRDWYQARTKCHDEGMIMVKTSEEEADIIRDGLIKIHGGANGNYGWLDAKYNGAQYVWNDGELIANDNELWYSGKYHRGIPELKADYCLLMVNSDIYNNENSKPYYTTSCTSTNYGRKAFCELI